MPEICKTPSAASKQQVINISCQQYTGATGPQSRHRLNQGTAHRIYGSVRAEQACDGTTTTRRTQCGLGCAAGCGGWAGSDTCFTHRFAALSALLPHGRFARCAPHAAIAAALAQQYLPCRPHGINAIRPVEMAVGPVWLHETVHVRGRRATDRRRTARATRRAPRNDASSVALREPRVHVLRIYNGRGSCGHAAAGSSSRRTMERATNQLPDRRLRLAQQRPVPR